MGGWLSPVSIEGSLTGNIWAKTSALSPDIWDNATGKNLSMEADVLIRRKERDQKVSHSTVRDWLDSKAPCRLWSEQKFSLRRNCCCACVGNNLGCKCSFASKEMLFSVGWTRKKEKRQQKPKQKKQSDLFSPNLGKHHLWFPLINFWQALQFWMRKLNVFIFVRYVDWSFANEKKHSLMISKGKGTCFIRFHAEWVKVKNTTLYSFSL